MAESYKGLTIKFGADYTELSKALTDIGKQTSAAQRELKAVQSALKLNPGNTQLLAKQQEALGQKVSATKSKLDAYNQALEILKKREQENGGLTESEQKQYDQLSRSIMTTEANLKQYTSQLGKARIEYAAHDSVMGKVGSKVTELGDKYGSAGEKVAKVSGKASTALVGTATATYGAFEQVEKGQNVALKASGAIGEAANGIKQAVKDVASHAPGDFETVGTAVGGVSAHFKVTGGDLDDLSTKFLKFAKVTGTDVASDIESVSMSMKAFNVPATQTGSVLDLIASTAATTGLSVDTLTSAVNQNGSTFREMGLSLQDSVTLMGNFEAAGIPADQMLMGLKRAAGECAKSGKSMGDMLNQLVNDLQNPAKQAEATNEVFALFGKKAALSFIDAAQSGRINLGALGGSIDSAAGYVDKLKSETTTAGDKMAGAFKQITLAGADFGEGFAPIVEKAAGVIQGLATQVKELPEPEKEAAVNAITLGAGITGVVAVGGKAVGSLSDMGKSITNAAKFFAKLGGAADDASGELTGSSVAMGVAKGGAIALATAGIAYLVSTVVDAIKKQETFKQATDGLRDACNGATGSVKSVSGVLGQIGASTSPAAQSLDSLRSSFDQLMEKQAQLAQTIRDRNTATQASQNQLEAYQKVIDEYANKSGLTADQQSKLKVAIDGVNSSTGSQYKVVDAANGKIADERGEIIQTTDAIDQYIQKKQLQAKIDGQTATLTDLYKQQAAAQVEVNNAQKAYDDWVRGAVKSGAYSAQKAEEMGKAVNDQKKNLEGINGSIKDVSGSLSTTQQVMDGTADAFTRLSVIAQNSGRNIDGLDAALKGAAINQDAFSHLSNTQLDSLTNKWDGSMSSIIGDLQKFGVVTPEFASAFHDMSGAISGMSGAGRKALDGLGLSSDDLAQKLAQAGISVESLNKVGGEGFANLYKSANGDLSKVKQAIDLLNHTGIDPKTVKVNDDGSITTETGAIVALDSIKIGDKPYTVTDNGSIVGATGAVTGFDVKTLATKHYTVTDDGSIQFENGNVLNLDNMTINGKHYTVSDDGTISVEGNRVDGLNANTVADKDFYISDDGTAAKSKSAVNDVTSSVNSIPSDPHVTVHADTERASGAIDGLLGSLSSLVSHVWTFVTSPVQANAAGGIRLNAAGGVRYHAGGAIATRAMPLDIVGEAGAEAIVPLTNKKYVTPFARAVAEQIAVVTAQGVPGVVQSPPAAPVVNISQKTQVVAADEDVYVAATIANRALVSAANQYL